MKEEEEETEEFFTFSSMMDMYKREKRLKTVGVLIAADIRYTLEKDRAMRRLQPSSTFLNLLVISFVGVSSVSSDSDEEI